MTLGYPLSKAKWFLVAKGITTLVGTLLVSRMNDKALKHGKVKLISLVVCVIFGVLSFLCSFVESFPLIMVYMALIGLVDGAWWAAYPVLVVEITSGYHSTEAFGLANLVIAFTRLPGPPILGKCRFSICELLYYTHYLDCFPYTKHSLVAGNPLSKNSVS